MVTQKQLNFYEDNGYLHIEGILESDLNSYMLLLFGSSKS